MKRYIHTYIHTYILSLFLVTSLSAADAGKDQKQNLFEKGVADIREKYERIIFEEYQGAVKKDRSLVSQGPFLQVHQKDRILSIAFDVRRRYQPFMQAEIDQLEKEIGMNFPEKG